MTSDGVTDPPPWVLVDRWLDGVLPAPDAVVAAQRTADGAGLPPIAVSTQQGRLLALLAASIGARRALEVGTLAGVSAVWLARALRGPDPVLTTFELSEHHAAVARENLAAAGLTDVVEVRVGPALEGLARLAAERPEPYDLAFIDADKPGNTAYLHAALALLRPGGLVVVDNVVRGGTVLDPGADAAARGSRAVIEAVAAHDRLTATVVQTVGSKGYDGMLVARLDV
ncbi:O-methyltransferase [Actinotalea fermentans]|uniref:O-methyltransferase n=1 Tax=Actinotalea fermentans TaxID=43671 RepID=A0A511YV02_9CELL|nr:O-methyltransferase [Actinotalea fermentans]KGM17880.1 hypothetical protein N867_00065 [Actinotalea fermentans ATCC 43279 = JCM 9966 = DSM 3133]GEN79024.1 O-methyltransferase [Actinotalea fermentans]